MALYFQHKQAYGTGDQSWNKRNDFFFQGVGAEFHQQGCGAFYVVQVHLKIWQRAGNLPKRLAKDQKGMQNEAILNALSKVNAPRNKRSCPAKVWHSRTFAIAAFTARHAR